MDTKKTAKTIKKLKKANVNDYRSIPFWSWNDKLDKNKLVDQIKWMKEQGFGGYFMHARGGLTTEYLGDEWFECTKACVEEGKKLKMSPWAYDENGWPSGFVGGKLLEDPENQDEYLTYDNGAFDEKALACYDVSGEELVRVKEGEKGKKYLRIYEHKSGATADILNPEVVNKFIDATHKEYKRRLGKKFSKDLCGFFTDEPQYFRWGHPYTKVLAKHFTEKYREDILDGLGLMFVEKKGYKSFRYKYWKGMQELLLNSFAKNVYNWCNKNGVGLTGHYIEEGTLVTQMWCCGGIMPMYEYENIPGVDHLGRRPMGAVASKQVSSVARQLGKKQVLTETYGLCGWGVTPRMLKVIAESQYVNGVNLMCQHLLPVAEHGQRKRDYPAHFSAVNPWVKEDFKSFNDYFANLGYLLGESDEQVSVALFNPIRSMYFDYKRDRKDDDFPTKYDADKSYIALANKLNQMNIPFHIIDETIMSKYGKVKDNKLIVGKCAYDTIVFPHTITMDKSTGALLSEYYSNGGKMLFTDRIPDHLEGEEFNYGFESNITLEEIQNAQEYTIDNLESTVRSTMRTFNDQKFIFAVNTSWEEGCDVEFSGEFNSFVKLDLETFETEKISKKIRFNPGDSYVLFLSDEIIEEAPKAKEISLSTPFKVLSATDNFLTIDKLRYSLDGENYTDKLRYMGVFFDLLQKKHCGDVWLKYEFDVKSIPKKLQFLSEDMRIKEFTVNGKPAQFTDKCEVEENLLIADIKDFVKEGHNEVIFKIDFYLSDRTHYIMLSEDDTESLKNCLTYETTIEACYLKGDFGVYSEDGFTKGNEKKVLLAEGNFYLDKKKYEVEDTVKDGYPFFSGKMVLYKEFEFDGGDAVLTLDGDFCLLNLSINGKPVKKSYFAERVDISDYVVKGRNVAEITLISGNRNLMGLHHLKDREEPTFVARAHFELEGTWKDGVSSSERSNYSFVKFGLYKED